MTITNNIISLQTRIREYETKYHRTPQSVTLLAASKSQSPEKIIEAYHAGQALFGENYLQEALDKMQTLASEHLTNLEWHFIGPMQSNKTRKIAEHFSWVHSVDSVKIATRLNEQRPSSLPPLNVCIEVNISQEESKSGVTLENLEELATFCQLAPHLTLRGLMAIPSSEDNMEDQRRAFKELHQLYKQLQQKGFVLDTLSMGMSEDFEAAIAEGSTMVRIGTALFGARS
jgi:pyridoxal phosphate enzyme (YggS family)